MGIGAGDYPVDYEAWHQPCPDAATRVARLEETVEALRRLWQGELVTLDGAHVRLTNAACTPTPPAPPRVMVGVGTSRRLIRGAVRYADEINLYADEATLGYARDRIGEAGRPVRLSVYLHFDADRRPEDLAAALARWDAPDIARVFVNVGYGWNLTERLRELAAAT